MASPFRRAALASVLACVVASPSHSGVGAPPWSASARSFALAPGSIDPDEGDARAGRAFGASVWNGAGLGIDLDGELWRVGEGRLTRSALLVDAGLGVRALDAGSLRIDLLTGARVDAAYLAGASGGASQAAADAVPMAAARATLGIADGVSLALRAGVAPDADLDAAWRLSGTLRFGLGDGWALLLDARWSSAEADPVSGTGAGQGPGRAAFWAGLSLPF